MLDELKKLTPAENDLVMDAMPLVTVLISGADGEFSKAEKDWASKVTHIRAYKDHHIMTDFYQKLEKTFAKRVEELIAELPNDPEERNQVISDKLAGLNDILAKMNTKLARRFYKNLISLAKQVAEADGGFLRFASINREESKLLGLKMITPIGIEKKE